MKKNTNFSVNTLFRGTCIEYFNSRIEFNKNRYFGRFDNNLKVTSATSNILQAYIYATAHSYEERTPLIIQINNLSNYKVISGPEVLTKEFSIFGDIKLKDIKQINKITDLENRISNRELDILEKYFFK